MKKTLRAVSLVLWIAGVSATGLLADSPAQPNVIFILTDDLGWGDLGVFHQNESKHNRKHKTPFLDQMAAEGMQLRAHYCPAPVCAPSRSSLLTGVHQGHAEVRDNQFDKMLEDNHTLGSVMKTAGYQTVLIGKWGLQGTGNSAMGDQAWPGYPTKRGFDEFFGYVRHRDGHLHYPAEAYPRGDSKSHQTPKEVWWNDQEVSSGLQKCYTTDLFTARAKQWIIEHQKSIVNSKIVNSEESEQPFFLMLNYDTPHAALQTPTGPYPKGQGVDGGIQWLGEPGQMINTANGEIDSWRHSDYTGHGWTEAEERFATMVRRIDSCVGDLLATLKELGIADNTIVIFTSDNGPHRESYLKNLPYAPTSFQSYGPFDGIKRDTWEGGVRMPTLAWSPGKISAGSIDHRPSQFHDWMATFADAAGMTAPARTDGVSLMPTLTGQGTQVPSTIYIEYAVGSNTPSYDDFLPVHRKRKRGQMQVIHLDGFKGIRTNIKSHADDFEIYDLKSDPQESKNLAGSTEAFVALQKKMHDVVLRMRMSNASAPRPYDDQPIPGLKKRGNEAANDVWKAYRGDFSFVPNLAGMRKNEGGWLGEKSEQETDEEDDDAVQQETKKFAVVSQFPPAAVQVEHWVNIEKTGEYTVTFQTPTRGFVRVHRCAAIDADFGYESGSRKTVNLKLGVGWHPVYITLLTDKEGVGSCDLEIFPVERE